MQIIKNAPPPEMRKEDLEATFKSMKERFYSPEPVTEEEIEKMYNTLFESDLGRASQTFLGDQNHIASLIFSLHEVIQHHRDAPSSALVSTATFGCEGSSDSYFVKGRSNQSLWVFKPALGEKVYSSEGIPGGGVAVREHFATIANDEGIYPIPFTAHVILFSREGSLQQVAPGRSYFQLLEAAGGFVPYGAEGGAIREEATRII